MTSSPRADLDPSERSRIRQQEIVAELGQHALEADDLEDVLQEATATTAETLETEFAAVLESPPATDEYVLRRGVGWRDDCVGTATVSTTPDSQAGHALRSERPIIADDLRADERFSDPDSLTDHGVVSGITVRIGSIEDPWGVLAVHATERRQFTEHDANVVRSIANILAMAFENERTDRRFEAVFDDPNILVGLLEPDGTVLDINRTAMEYIDADLADVTGEQFWETPWWGDGGEIHSDVKEWTERAAAGEYVEFETDIFGTDGKEHTINGVFRPVTNDDGDVVSIVVSDRDITERKAHERYLRDAKEQLEAATEAGAVGTWEWKIPEN